MFYVSLAGFGLGLGLGPGVGLVTAGLDYITVSRTAHLTGSSFSETNSSKSVTTANVFPDNAFSRAAAAAAAVHESAVSRTTRLPAEAGVYSADDDGDAGRSCPDAVPDAFQSAEGAISRSITAQ